jgi:outer membrane protein TolC
MSLQKAQEIAEAEVSKQKRHIFSYLTGHASFSYGVSDMWGNTSSSYYTLQLMQFTGREQKYWNVGVNLAVPLEDILDLGAAVKRKKLEVDQAVYNKDLEYDKLKLQIAQLYTNITNNLIALKTASENAAIYQGAGALNLEDFHNGNMSIEDFAWTKTREDAAVSKYQSLQTQVITDILTLEIITHTPILTNSTTEITLDKSVEKSAKQIAKENKAVEKRIKKSVEEENKRLRALEKAEAKAEKAAQKAAAKNKK